MLCEGSTVRSKLSKSGNTTDDTGDDMKPSSLIEGIALKPVQCKNSSILILYVFPPTVDCDFIKTKFNFKIVFIQINS